MKAVNKHGQYIDGLALFYELTDELIVKVSCNKDWYLDDEFVKQCISAEGPHAHFFCLYSPGNNMNVIYSNIKHLLRKYKTVSWWDRDLEEFVITNGGRDATGNSSDFGVGVSDVRKRESTEGAGKSNAAATNGVC